MVEPAASAGAAAMPTTAAAPTAVRPPRSRRDGRQADRDVEERVVRTLISFFLPGKSTDRSVDGATVADVRTDGSPG
ncbi:hypothetical protein GCM10027294_29660 [Marinactinospora endophytica]